MAEPDLGADSDTLKKGAKDVLEALRPTEGFSLEGAAGRSGVFGESEAAAAFAAFCGTWQVGAQMLSGRTAKIAAGVTSSSSTFKNTDGDVHGMVNSVKTN